MNTVYFNEYNSWEDFSLFLKTKKIESPAPKTEEVDIPGGNGVIDLTEHFGEVKFKNRKISLDFTTFGTREELAEITSNFQNAVQGKRMQIRFTDDPYFYYIGRVKIKTPSDKQNIRTIQLEITAEPFKYRTEETVIRKTINGTITLSCPNLRKTVVPQIVTDGNITISFGNVSTSLSAGTYLVPEIYFTEGINVLTVNGNATFEIRYREGGL